MDVYVVNNIPERIQSVQEDIHQDYSPERNRKSLCEFKQQGFIQYPHKKCMS